MGKWGEKGRRKFEPSLRNPAEATVKNIILDRGLMDVSSAAEVKQTSRMIHQYTINIVIIIIIIIFYTLGSKDPKG